MKTPTVTWQTTQGVWHATAASSQTAARAIRAQLLAHGQIGKYTAVTVEPVQGSENEYVEVWS